MKDLYKELSDERKRGQEAGDVPMWYTTSGYQLFKDKYLYKANSIREQFMRIATSASKHLRVIGMEDEARDKFFNLFWEGKLSPSTPVLANMGTDRGMPVSCSGGVIEDSIDGFYSNLHETALLTKNGFGTSSDLSSIRPRGSKISKGGTSSGVLPVFKMHVQAMRDVAQGTSRRGAWAGYLDIEHGDFDELCDYVKAEPDDANVGWIVHDSFIDRLKSGDEDALRRYQKAMHTKAILGKGYWCFIDKINRNRPRMYVDMGMFVKASNLCDEITLFADAFHTYTCVLSSINMAMYDSITDDDIFWATVFLDCVAQEFIEKGSQEIGLEKAVRFTEKGRALGLGQCGLHTYLQNKMIPFESFEAHMFSTSSAKRLDEVSLKASQWMADKLGEPEWCKGYGVRNTHRIAIAPTKSTALLMGGVSEGINPDPAMVYTQSTAGGEVERVNPKLLTIMKERGKFTKRVITDIKDRMGSVQHVDWLTDEEKLVFKTAFEINQESIIRMASVRGNYIDQWQSLNLFFSADEEESYISEIHQKAFEDENILGLYYIYSMAGVQASKDECVACQ
jgi:ribonucleoside-diphosphate reductase alpha chain